MSAAEPVATAGGPETYPSAVWVSGQLKRPLSRFEAIVATILGATFRGIYHLEAVCHGVSRGDWSSQRVSVPVDRGLATYDFNELAVLVILAHDAAVRFEVRPVNMTRMRLSFWPRERSGEVWDRHPTLEAAAEQVRTRLADLRQFALEAGEPTGEKDRRQ